MLSGLLIVPLLLGMGLVIDTGLMLFSYRGLRNAADAAAMAGAYQRSIGAALGGDILPEGALAFCASAPARSSVQAACAIAQSHGYAPGEIEVYVEGTGVILPHSVDGASKQVEVILNRPYATVLMRLAGITDVPVVGIAVAGQRAAAAGAAIYALDQDACAGFDRTGIGGVYIFGGPIFIDSTAADGCNPAGGALDKDSGGILCVDANRGDYPLGDGNPATPDYGYGCDGDGLIKVAGGVSCSSDPSCATIKSIPDLNDGPGDAIPSGDPYSKLPGPDHTDCAAVTAPEWCPNLDADLALEDPDTRGHAFEFCDDDGLNGIDSARLNFSDSRIGPAFGTTAGATPDCAGTILPTSPLIAPVVANTTPIRAYNVCDDGNLVGGVHHIKPGIYWGGIKTQGNCEEPIHFDAGIYIMAGQDSESPNPRPSIGLNFSASGGDVTGGPLLFFITSNPGVDPADESYRPPGPVLFQTSQNFNLSASILTEGECPTGESYEGMILFFARTAEQAESTGGTNSNKVTVQGGSGGNMTISGIWYDPNGEFQAEGSFRLLDSQLIFNVIDMQNQNDVIITLPACRAKSNQLFLLR